VDAAAVPFHRQDPRREPVLAPAVWWRGNSFDSAVIALPNLSQARRPWTATALRSKSWRHLEPTKVRGEDGTVMAEGPGHGIRYPNDDEYFLRAHHLRDISADLQHVSLVPAGNDPQTPSSGDLPKVA